MAMKAKHAFGNSSSIEAAKQANKIDAFDILFLDGDTEPKIGWIDSNGNTVLVDHRADLAKVEASIEAEIAKKADASEVDAMIAAALDEHLEKRYEILSAPVGTLVDYGEREIRIMCPTNSVFEKQNVGVGGDPNCYYATFRTYVPNDNVVGYKEYMGNQSDSEILTTFSTDEHGRRFQSTWLALAKYDEANDVWNYYGKSSSASKYIGWDYKIEWFDADDIMISSDSIRINLSNEDCHYHIEPYYVGKMKSDIEIMIDEKFADFSAYEIVEF